MKVATNIILIAIALYLSIEILSRIDKTQVDTIKNTFAVEQVSGKNYTLIPKKWGLDTVNVSNVHNVETLEIQSTFNTYKLFISNNELVYAMNTEDYEVK